MINEIDEQQFHLQQQQDEQKCKKFKINNQMNLNDQQQQPQPQQQLSLNTFVAYKLPKIRNNWFSNEELFTILNNYDVNDMSNDVQQLSHSGSLYLFDRNKIKNFKKDLFTWKRRKDGGNSVREDRMSLKLNGIELIYGCYSHSAIMPSFHRRSYWLINKPNVVLVHYLTKPLNENGELIIINNKNNKQFKQIDVFNELKQMLWPYSNYDYNKTLIEHISKELTSTTASNTSQICNDQHQIRIFIDTKSNKIIYENYQQRQQSPLIDTNNILPSSTGSSLPATSVSLPSPPPSSVTQQQQHESQQSSGNEQEKQFYVTTTITNTNSSIFIINKCSNYKYTQTSSYKISVDDNRTFYCCKYINDYLLQVNLTPQFSVNNVYLYENDNLLFIEQLNNHQPQQFKSQPPPTTTTQQNCCDNCLFNKYKYYLFERLLLLINNLNIKNNNVIYLLLINNDPSIQHHRHHHSTSNIDDDDDPTTAAHLSTYEQRYVNIIKYLIDNYKPTNETTLLLFDDDDTTSTNDKNCCDLINSIDNLNEHEGKTLLHLCVICSYNVLFEYIIKLNQQINQYLNNNNNNSSSSNNNFYNNRKYLYLYNEFNPLKIDNYGNTPLMLACMNGNRKLAIELCKLNKNGLNQMNMLDNLKPIDICKQNGYLDLARELEEFERDDQQQQQQQDHVHHHHHVVHHHDSTSNHEMSLLESEDVVSVGDKQTNDQTFQLIDDLIWLNDDSSAHANILLDDTTSPPSPPTSQQVVVIEPIVIATSTSNASQENDVKVGDSEQHHMIGICDDDDEDGDGGDEHLIKVDENHVVVEQVHIEAIESSLFNVVDLDVLSNHQSSASLMINDPSQQTLLPPPLPPPSIQPSSATTTATTTQSSYIDDQDKKIKTLADNIIAAMPLKIKSNSYLITNPIQQQPQMNDIITSTVIQSPLPSTSSIPTTTTSTTTTTTQTASTNQMIGSTIQTQSTQQSQQQQQQQLSNASSLSSIPNTFDVQQIQNHNEFRHQNSILSNDDYSSSLSPQHSPSSTFHIDSPPSTAEFCQYFHKSVENDFAQLTLTDDEQRELYEAALIIQNAYRRYLRRKKTRVDTNLSLDNSLTMSSSDTSSSILTNSDNIPSKLIQTSINDTCNIANIALINSNSQMANSISTSTASNDDLIKAADINSDDENHIDIVTKQYEAACIIQKYFRRYKQYEHLRKYTEAAVKIQTKYRAYREIKQNDGHPHMSSSSNSSIDNPTTTAAASSTSAATQPGGSIDAQSTYHHHHHHHYHHYHHYYPNKKQIKGTEKTSLIDSKRVYRSRKTSVINRTTKPTTSQTMCIQSSTIQTNNTPNPMMNTSLSFDDSFEPINSPINNSNHSERLTSI